MTALLRHGHCGPATRPVWVIANLLAERAAAEAHEIERRL